MTVLNVLWLDYVSVAETILMDISDYKTKNKNVWAAHIQILNAIQQLRQ